jgi:hypothetical protein
VRLHRRANDGPPVALRLRVPGAVHTALAAYAEYYAYEHGEPIEVPDLVIEIVRTFVSNDREFRRWQRNGRAPTPATPGERNEQEEGPR